MRWVNNRNTFAPEVIEINFTPRSKSKHDRVLGHTEVYMYQAQKSRDTDLEIDLLCHGHNWVSSPLLGIKYVCNNC